MYFWQAVRPALETVVFAPTSPDSLVIHWFGLVVSWPRFSFPLNWIVWTVLEGKCYQQFEPDGVWRFIQIRLMVSQTLTHFI